MKKRLTYLTSVIVVLLLVLALCSRNNADVPAMLATAPLTSITPASETLAPSDIADTQTFREATFHESENQKNIGETTTETQRFREATFHESDSKTATNIMTESTEDVATTPAPTDDSNRLTNVEILASGCNLNTPNWGESLGTASFYTSYEWRISGWGILQIWSNAVTATACQKTTFDGGTMRGDPANSDFNADCRSNPGFPGDFFSWCAVVRFADVLCPYPWRVPTMQDFVNLDIALGGTGENRSDGNRDFVAIAYINRWGGVFAGCTRYGRLSPGSFSCYWSIDERCGNYAFNLIYSRIGGVRPQDRHRKMHGLAVRCVR